MKRIILKMVLVLRHWLEGEEGRKVRHELATVARRRDATHTEMAHKLDQAFKHLRKDHNGQ